MPETTRRARLPRSARLRRRSEFEAVRRERRVVRNGVLRIGWRPNGLGWTRLGLAVTRRLGPAPVRNRMKRILREAFRLDRPALPRGLDLVVAPVDPERASRLDVVRSSLRSLLDRIARGPEGRP